MTYLSDNKQDVTTDMFTSGAGWVQDGCRIFSHPAPVILLYIRYLMSSGAEGAGFFGPTGIVRDWS